MCKNAYPQPLQPWANILHVYSLAICVQLFSWDASCDDASLCGDKWIMQNGAWKLGLIIAHCHDPKYMYHVSVKFNFVEAL